MNIGDLSTPPNNYFKAKLATFYTFLSVLGISLLLQPSIVNCVYLLFFLFLLTLRHGPRFQRSMFEGITTCILTYSLVILTFLIVTYGYFNESTFFLSDLWQTIIFTPCSTNFQVFRLFAPCVLVTIFSSIHLLTLIIIRNNSTEMTEEEKREIEEAKRKLKSIEEAKHIKHDSKVAQAKVDDGFTAKAPARPISENKSPNHIVGFFRENGKHLLPLILILLLCSSVPNFLGLVYLCYLFFHLVFPKFRTSLLSYLSLFVPLHMIGVYIFQFHNFVTHNNSKFLSFLGLVPIQNFRVFHDTLILWPYLVQYILILLLFVLVSSRYMYYFFAAFLSSGRARSIAIYQPKSSTLVHPLMENELKIPEYDEKLFELSSLSKNPLLRQLAHMHYFFICLEVICFSLVFTGFIPGFFVIVAIVFFFCYNPKDKHNYYTSNRETPQINIPNGSHSKKNSSVHLEHANIVMFFLLIGFLYFFVIYLYNNPLFPHSVFLGDIGIQKLNPTWVLLKLTLLFVLLSHFSYLSYKLRYISHSKKGQGSKTYNLEQSEPNTSPSRLERFAAFFIRYAYLVIAAGSCYFSLHHPDALHLGHLFFALLLFALTSSPRFTKFIWLLLTIYGTLCFLLMFFWQVSYFSRFEGNKYTKILGLFQYKNFFPRFWMTFHAIVYLFQWKVRFVHPPVDSHVDYSTKSGQKKTSREAEFPSFLFLIIILLIFIFEQFSMIVFITWFILFYLCMIYFIFQKREKIYKINIRALRVFIFLMAIIVLARFSFQNNMWYDFVVSHYPPNAFISLDDLGLLQGSALRLSIPYLLVYLLLILFQRFTQYTLALIIKESTSLQKEQQQPPKVDQDDDKDVIKPPEGWATRLQEKVFLFILHCQAVTYYNVGILFLIIIFWLCLNLLTFFSLCIIFLTLISYFFRSSRSANIISFAIYMFSSFSVFLGSILNFHGFSNFIVQNREWLDWIGVYPAQYFKFINSGLFILISLLVTVYRIASLVIKEHEQIMTQPIAPTNSLLPYSNEINRKDKTKISIYENVSGFLRSVTEQYSTTLLFLLLCFAIWMRMNALGLFYIFILMLIFRFSSSNLIFATKLLKSVLFTLILAQCFILLGLPPIVTNRFPWLFNDNFQLDLWLLLKASHRSLLLVDFFVFLGLYRLCLTMEKEKLENNGAKTASRHIELGSFLKCTYNFVNSPHCWQDTWRFWIFNSGEFFVLILLFFAGTMEADVLSLVYLIFSLVFLTRIFSKDIRIKPFNWDYLRWINYCIIILQICIQPVFALFGQIPWSSTIGLRELDLSVNFPGGPTVYNIIILLILEYHREIYSFHPVELSYVYAYEKNQYSFAFKNTKDLLYRQRDERIKNMELVKQARIDRQERLKLLKGRRLAIGKQDLEPVDELIQLYSGSVGPSEIPVESPLGSEEGTPVEKTTLFDRLFKFLLKDNMFSSSVLLDNTQYKGTKFQLLIRGLNNLARRYSFTFCLFAFTINMALSGSFIALIFPLVGFSSLMLSFPRPKKGLWNFLAFFSANIIFLKFIFQFSCFCLCQGKNGLFWWASSIARACDPSTEMCPHPRCDIPNMCDFPVVGDYNLTLPLLIGIFTTQGPFLLTIAPDLLTFWSILLHKRVMGLRGIWDSRMELIQHECSRDIHEFHRNQLLKDIEAGTENDTIHESSGYVSHSPQTAQKSKFALRFHRYFSHLTNSKEKIGWERDYYTYIFLIEFFCFIFIMLFQQSFTGVPGHLSQFLQRSLLPRQYVAVLLIQFLLILLDRIIYLYKSLTAKVVLQWFTLIVFHAVLCFIFPFQNGQAFKHSLPLIIFYFAKCLYWLVSSLQIRYGYPFSVGGRVLMDDQKPLNNFTKNNFTVYRSIPFIFEIRNIIDWIVHRTTLNFYQWMKFEDIYAELFLVKCRLEIERKSGRHLGTKQSVSTKFFSGVLLLIVLLLVLWFPLLLLSSGSPGTISIPVDMARTEIGIRGWDPVLEVETDINIFQVGPKQFDDYRSRFKFLTKDDRNDLTLINLNGFSEQNWEISPPAFSRLIEILNSSIKVELDFILTLHRSTQGVGPELLSTTRNILLDDAQKVQLHNLILQQTTDPLIIKDIFPRFLRLPGATGTITFPSVSDTITVELFLKGSLFNQTDGGNVLWWEVKQKPEETFNLTNSVQIVTISTPIPTGVIQSLASVGVIGLYATIVLTVGRFLRMYISSLVHRIVIEDMQNVDILLQLCKDIFLSRSDDEDLILEESLYIELIQLFRSPDSLFKISKKKKIQ